MDVPVEDRERGADRARGARALAWALAVALAAALVLLAQAHLFDPSRLHVHNRFTDQAFYITSARVLLDEGELRNGVIFPAYVEDPRWRLYMPGHFVALASSYALFGYGVLQSLLPSLGAHVLTAACTFLIGNRLYGRTAGLAAAGLFLLFPVNALYAFTAMAEMTFTAAACVALTALLYLPARARPFALPLLLLLPFLFRETGAVCALVLGLVVLRPPEAPAWLRWRTALLSLGGAALALFAMAEWQASQGKGSVPLSWVTEGRFNYLNAFPNPAPELSAGGWAELLAANLGRNVRVTVEQFRDRPLSVATVGLALVFSAALGSLVLGLRRLTTRGRDPFPLVAGLTVVLVLLAIYTLYDAKRHKALRNALFVLPPCLVALGSLADGRWLRGRAALLSGVLGVLLVAGSYATAARAGGDLRRWDACIDDARAKLERLEHDPAKLLVVDFELAKYFFDYAVVHYPVPWSYCPANPETLDLLARRYEIGTVILESTKESPVALRVSTPGGGGATLPRCARLPLGHEGHCPVTAGAVFQVP